MQTLYNFRSVAISPFRSQVLLHHERSYIANSYCNILVVIYLEMQTVSSDC